MEEEEEQKQAYICSTYPHTQTHILIKSKDKYFLMLLFLCVVSGMRARVCGLRVVCEWCPRPVVWIAYKMNIAFVGSLRVCVCVSIVTFTQTNIIYICEYICFVFSHIRMFSLCTSNGFTPPHLHSGTSLNHKSSSSVDMCVSLCLVCTHM